MPAAAPEREGAAGSIPVCHRLRFPEERSRPGSPPSPVAIPDAIPDALAAAAINAAAFEAAAAVAVEPVAGARAREVEREVAAMAEVAVEDESEANGRIVRMLAPPPKRDVPFSFLGLRAAPPPEPALE